MGFRHSRCSKSKVNTPLAVFGFTLQQLGAHTSVALLVAALLLGTIIYFLG